MMPGATQALDRLDVAGKTVEMGRFGARQGCASQQSRHVQARSYEAHQGSRQHRSKPQGNLQQSQSSQADVRGMQLDRRDQLGGVTTPWAGWYISDARERCKELEFASEGVAFVPEDKHWLVRLDGSCFTQWTKDLHKPFDINFLRAMVCTTNDMLRKFGAATAYTQSDEITLIFAPQPRSEQPLRGESNDILSRFASYAALRFNFHMSRYVLADPTYGSQIRREGRRFGKCFDCRIMVAEEGLDILRHMYWRSVGDCGRNASSQFTRKVLPGAKMRYLKQDEQLRMLAGAGLDWGRHVPGYVKYGTWGKQVASTRPVWREDVGAEVMTQEEHVVNFTCNLRYIPEWEWMLQPGLSTPGVGRKVGLADGDILELVKGNTWYPPIVARTGELVHPELVYQGQYNIA